MKKIALSILLLLVCIPVFANDTIEIPMLKDRVLGDPNAPVTIVEHSSFTCPHCRSFHTNVLPEVKEKLIDTGKAKLQFADFPLNKPAVDVGLIARCFKDNDSYFEYVEFMFETQEQWFHLPDVRPFAAQNARLLGLSSEDLDTCMKTEGYQDAFLKKVQLSAQFKQIQSTPTFIIAETGERILGAKSFMHFETAVNSALKSIEKKQEDLTPAE